MAKQALGRGFESLIPGKGRQPQAAGKGIAEIQINEIRANPDQPRKNFNPEKMDELIRSIKENGLIEPIVVKESGGKYEIVAGERRFIAAQRAGLKALPAVIKNVTPAKQFELALAENIIREELNPLEEAQAYKRIMEENKWTQDEAADKLGRSRATVANTLRILKLTPEIQQYIKDGELSLGHAKAILAIDDKNRQKAVASLAVRKGLSVREVESMAKDQPGKKSAPKKSESAEMKSMADKLKIFFGTKVKINGSYKKGNIIIEYYSSEDFDRIMEILEI
ncbi:MAG: ParB/RepB/Spo0J family partition protein [Spirochaetia bacterium]|nr:ParB/RepB/Spo0J family partition protein [Spirochaetia bacterium]